MKFNSLINHFAILFLSNFLLSFSFADGIPLSIPYKGAVLVDGEAFDGAGEFKFAIVNGNCANAVDPNCESLWSNDGKSQKGNEPEFIIKLPVAKGQFYVKLGDTSLTGMTELTPEIFDNEITYIRIWFNDGINGFQQLSNDKQLVSVPYSYYSNKAKKADQASAVIDGAIGATSINPTEVQKRVQACADGKSIQSINEDGSVECINNEVYTASSGLVSSNNAFSIEQGLLDKIDSAAAKAISAGAGLVSATNNGNQQISVAPSGITNTHIASIDWSKVSGVPADIADGDNGITVEVDPSVPASIKDGISWNEISNRPVGLDDGDNEGLTSVGQGLTTINNKTVSIDAVTMSKINNAALNTDVDVIKSFFELFSCNAMTKNMKFNYSNNNGVVTIGSGEFAFDLKWRANNGTEIYLNNDSANVVGVAATPYVFDELMAMPVYQYISDVTDASSYDMSLNEVIVSESALAIVKNTSNNYAVLQINSISNISFEQFATVNEINFYYCIRPYGQTDFR